MTADVSPARLNGEGEISQAIYHKDLNFNLKYNISTIGVSDWGGCSLYGFMFLFSTSKHSHRARVCPQHLVIMKHLFIPHGVFPPAHFSCFYSLMHIQMQM